MAITWQNVGAPNIGSGIQAGAIGADMISSGLDRLSAVAGDQHAKGLKRSRADLQHSLLGLASQDIGEKEFLSKALNMGKDSGLDPNQVLEQVDSIKGIREQAASLTQEQQLEYDALNARLEQANVLGQQGIKQALTVFDQDNPQVRIIGAEHDAFRANGGLGTTMSKVYGGIEDDGDRQETREAVLKLRNSGEYDEFAIAKTVEELGVGEAGLIFDGALFNSRKFKNSLEANQKNYNTFKDNVKERQSREFNLTQAHAMNLQKLRQDARKYHEDTRKSNLKSFSF